VDGKQVIIGHRMGSQWVVDRAVSFNATAGTDVVLTVSVRAGLVNVSVNGAVVASTLFNEQGTDGRYGLMGRNGLTSFDRVQLRSDDVTYATTTTTTTAALVAAPAGTTTTGTQSTASTSRTASATTTSFKAPSVEDDALVIDWTLPPSAPTGDAVATAGTSRSDDWRLRFVDQAAAPAAKANTSLKLQLPVSLLQAGAGLKGTASLT
jgi:hypothetical protein